MPISGEGGFLIAIVLPEFSCPAILLRPSPRRQFFCPQAASLLDFLCFFMWRGGPAPCHTKNTKNVKPATQDRGFLLACFLQLALCVFKLRRHCAAPGSTVSSAGIGAASRTHQRRRVRTGKQRGRGDKLFGSQIF